MKAGIGRCCKYFQVQFINKKINEALEKTEVRKLIFRSRINILDVGGVGGGVVLKVMHGLLKHRLEQINGHEILGSWSGCFWIITEKPKILWYTSYWFDILTTFLSKKVSLNEWNEEALTVKNLRFLLVLGGIKIVFLNMPKNMAFLVEKAHKTKKLSKTLENYLIWLNNCFF